MQKRKQTNENFFCNKKIVINWFPKKFHLLFLKKFSPLCKNKQDFFVNSHSLIRGRTFFGAILICIKNKYDYKIMWKKMLPTIKTLLFSWNQFHENFKFCHVFKVACNVYVCASARFFFVFITNIKKKINPKKNFQKIVFASLLLSI